MKSNLWSVTVAAVACCLWAGGCNLQPSERVELYEQQLVKIESLLAEHGPKVDALQLALDNGLTMISDVNLPIEDRQKAWQTVQKIRDVLTQAVAYKAKLETWLAQTKDAIDQIQAAGTVDTGGELDVIGQAVSQGGKAVGGSIGAIVGLVGLGISLLGNWLQKRTNNSLTTAAAAVVKGIENAPDDAKAATKESIANVMDIQGVYTEANAVVDQLKAA